MNYSKLYSITVSANALIVVFIGALWHAMQFYESNKVCTTDIKRAEKLELEEATWNDLFVANNCTQFGIR
jgi:hypothetical protein